jgi:hypothetical protein
MGEPTYPMTKKIIPRNVECQKYDQCLDRAAKSNKVLFCAGCDPSKVSFEEAPIKQEIQEGEVKEMPGKECSKCRKTKPLNEFSVKKSNPDGLQNHCKDCVAEYYRKYRIKNLVKKDSNGRKRGRKARAVSPIQSLPQIEDALYLPPESIKALKNAGIKEAIKILERALA